MFALSIKRVVGLSQYATNGVQAHLPLQLRVGGSDSGCRARCLRYHTFEDQPGGIDHDLASLWQISR